MRVLGNDNDDATQTGKKISEKRFPGFNNGILLDGSQLAASPGSPYGSIKKVTMDKFYETVFADGDNCAKQIEELAVCLDYREKTYYGKLNFKYETSGISHEELL